MQNPIVFRLSKTYIYATSWPYPVDVAEGLASSFEGLQAPPFVGLSEQMSSSFLALGGELKRVLWVYDEYAPEAIDASFAGLSGELKSVFREYENYTPEAIDAQFVSVSGSLKAVLIEYENYGSEAIDSSFLTVTGSLS